MHLKDDTEDEHYSNFGRMEAPGADQKYSDYIRFPIRMAVTKTKKVASLHVRQAGRGALCGDGDLNSMVPIWQRKKRPT